jgi:hypothetical protein
MEQFESHYFRGQGGLMLGDLDANNNPSNLIYIGDMESAELSPDVSRDSVIENRSGNSAVAASWLNSVRYNFSAAMRSVKPEHLAQALQASVTVKAAGSVTDESHTGNHGAMIALLHTNVSNVVVTNAAGTTTYTENTDYVVHAEDGLIEVLSTADGGNMVDAAEALHDYDYAAQHHLKTNPSGIEKCLVFSGLNSANNNKRVRCEIYKIKLDPSVLSMITSGAATMPISGEVQVVSTRPAGDQQYSWKLQD